MPFRWNPAHHVLLARYILKWLVIAAVIAAFVGSAVAFFLWALDRATAYRWDHPWLLYLLPVAGLVIGYLYHRFGKGIEAGNNLIVEQIHEPGGGVPARMAPFVLGGTLVTHLFGGSAGREGTAVQMGGSIASSVGRLLNMDAADTRRVLMAGIAAGFGAVFGTPITGAIFAMEVLAIGRMSYEGLIPCLIASTLADFVCTRWRIVHTNYHLLLPEPKVALDGLDALLFGKVLLAGAAFGLASVIFAELTHGVQRLAKTFIAWPPLRPALGGALVIGLTLLLGTRSYLGLGVTSPDRTDVTIVTCFAVGGATALSWWWKSLFTAVTVGSGFKGGEVTPLFFVGAALGNALSRLLAAPTDLFAALGFVGVFAGATNTPLACTIMGIELFGHSYAVYIATACFTAYVFSGHSGIYLSQRIGVPKVAQSGVEPDASLRAAREQHPPVIRVNGVNDTMMD